MKLLFFYLFLTDLKGTNEHSARFLQITHKSCRGPEGQWGTCMFNFECQQQKGEVIGACLDRFLFGACCQLSSEDSITAVDTSAVKAVGIPNSTHPTNSQLVIAYPFLFRSFYV